jgi:hypothetical protein
MFSKSDEHEGDYWEFYFKKIYNSYSTKFLDPRTTHISKKYDFQKINHLVHKHEAEELQNLDTRLFAWIALACVHHFQRRQRDNRVRKCRSIKNHKKPEV